MKKHYDIRVLGLVQGVWFRKNTKIQADRLGLYGFVRNEHDGSVFIEVEGAHEMLEEFVRWCHRGPDRAMVDQVFVEERTAVGYATFNIQS